MKKQLYFTLFCLLAFLLHGPLLFAQVKIGDNPGTKDASSVLELEKTDMGILIPRVSLTDANDNTSIPNPAGSLLIFNTNTGGTGGDVISPGFYYWNSDDSRWMRLISGSGNTNNTASGYQAAYYNAGDDVNAFGYYSAYANSGWSVNALGVYTAAFNNGVNINALGASAVQDNQGDQVNAIGVSACRENTGSHVNGMGYEAARYNNGDYAIAIGYQALAGSSVLSPEGEGNIAIGYQAGINIGMGYNNIAIGYDAQVPDGDASDQINIGNNIIRDAEGVIYLNDLIQLSPTTTPSNPQPGMIYFDSGDNILYCFDGADWQALW